MENLAEDIPLARFVAGSCIQKSSPSGKPKRATSEPITAWVLECQFSRVFGKPVGNNRWPPRKRMWSEGMILSGLRRLRRTLVMPAQELVQRERDFVGMRCAPGNNALQLDGIVCNGADFHQLGFDDLQVSHRNFSMAHFGTRKGEPW